MHRRRGARPARSFSPHTGCRRAPWPPPPPYARGEQLPGREHLPDAPLEEARQPQRALAALQHAVQHGVAAPAVAREQEREQIEHAVLHVRRDAPGQRLLRDRAARTHIVRREKERALQRGKVRPDHGDEPPRRGRRQRNAARGGPLFEERRRARLVAAGELHRALRRERLEQRRCFGRRAALHHQQQRRLRHGGGVGGERRLLRGGQVAHDDDAAAVEKRQRFARGLHVRRRRRVEPLHVERARRLRRQRRRLAHRLLLAVFLLAVQQVRARKRRRLLRGRLPHGLEKPHLVHAPIIQESVPPRNARGLRRPRGIGARRAPAAAHPISGEIPPALPAPAARAPLPPRKKAGILAI